MVDEYLEHFCKSYSNFESFEKDLISDFAIESFGKIYYIDEDIEYIFKK